MTMNICMDALKRLSIRIHSGMIVVWPQYGKEETLDLSMLVPTFNGCYATKNSTVCWIYDNKIFVTPWIDDAMKCLEAEGFHRKNFYVPFSNWDYPKGYRNHSKWNYLCRKLNEKKCMTYSDELQIGALKPETLERCLEVPPNGIEVTYPSGRKDCYCPVMSPYHVSHELGHFCANGGTTVFVYRNGKTYVTPERNIVNELLEAGYGEMNMDVPFTNGERIKSLFYRREWEQIMLKCM